MRRSGLAMTLCSLALLAGACGGGDDADAGPTETSEPAASATPSVSVELPPGCPTPAFSGPVEYDEALHDELVAMLERDQAGRTGGVDDEGDALRSARLAEILEEHGWPGFDLVGEDGEDAAWAIAQHADLEPEIQRCALAHLEVAVQEDQGSPGNLAYLSDRVTTADDGVQRYGTQVSCGRRGQPPEPAVPLEDPDRVDEFRAEVGLPPLDDYLDEMAEICSS